MLRIFQLTRYHLPGDVQRRCAGKRFGQQDEYNGGIWHQLPKQFSADTTMDEEHGGRESGRTAIVLRTWDDYQYTETRRAWLRAFIAETALHSDGEYQVFLLVNVKDDEIRLGDDPDAYARALRECVPEEFRDMALLYNSPVLENWYPRVDEHGPQDQMYQALQIFSHKFPQFNHVWQLEMDLRTTGHLGGALAYATAFARSQPRRNLWERNGRFYIPKLHGGSYTAFAQEVDAEIGEDGVWGPAYTTDFEPKGPKPPPRSHRDWGVDEDAELISLMPMIDPNGTEWVYERDVYGFADGTDTPRRAAFVSMTRSSRRLLQLVSEAQRERGQWVVSEATLETFALLHGLKAVTVPQPIALEKGLSAKNADKLINRGPPHSKAGGEAPSMAYTTSGFVQGPWDRASYWFAANNAPDFWHRYLDGECIPPMLLHPVKDE